MLLCMGCDHDAFISSLQHSILPTAGLQSSAATVGQWQCCMWEVAQKGLVCGGTCWQSTAFPLGFALRSSTQVYGVSLSPVSSFLHLCVHMSMWKEREKPGISDEESGGDILSYKLARGYFIASIRLEETCKITESNHWPNIARSTIISWPC